MSNILYREVVWTYRWLRTYWPWRITRKRPVMTGIFRRASRKKMSENRVFASLWAWLKSWLNGENYERGR